jgi:hypothetical protein
LSSSRKIEVAYFDLQSLAVYTSISVRCWRDLLRQPGAPPIYRLGKLLVKKSDVDVWLERFRQEPGQGLAAVVDSVMEKFEGGR